jgi:hypothetical protein
MKTNSLPNRCWLLLLISFCMFACSGGESTLVSPVPLDSGIIERGKQLTKGLAACGFCHGESSDPSSLLAGGQIFFDRFGPVTAPNLTPARSGLASWRDAEILKAIRAALGREEQWLSLDAHQGFEWMADEDVMAVTAYLRSLPPIEKQIERRELGFIDRNTTGIFESRQEVRGFVPRIDQRERLPYGQYLTDHVARCTACHNGPGSLLDGEAYLLGGKTIRRGADSRVSPGITSSRVYGIGDWDEQAIVNYLQTGAGPDGRSSDPDYCPWPFYSNARIEDLEAIAAYLRTVPG